MPKVGDRVIIEGAKIGQQRREGSLIGVTGRLLNVRWNDGSSSLLTPGAGSVTFLPGRGKAASPASKAKGSSAPKKTPARKKTAKKSVAAKGSARRASAKAKRPAKGKGTKGTKLARKKR